MQEKRVKGDNGKVEDEGREEDGKPPRRTLVLVNCGASPAGREYQKL